MKVADRPSKVGDVVKYESNLADFLERDVKDLTIAAFSQKAPHGVEIGQVYNTLTGVLVAKAAVANLKKDGTTPLGILVDDGVYGSHAAGVKKCGVLTGGVGASGGAVVIRQGLKFADTLTSGEIDTVVGVLNSQGIKVVANVI